MQPSSIPTLQPFSFPTSVPSGQPVGRPSIAPSIGPSSLPSSQPSTLPSSEPSSQPSIVPSRQPTNFPSTSPSTVPSSCPSMFPSSQPTSKPSNQPSSQPTSLPTLSSTRWVIRVDSIVDIFSNYSDASSNCFPDHWGFDLTGRCSLRLAFTYCLVFVPWVDDKIEQCIVQLPAASVLDFNGSMPLIMSKSNSTSNIPLNIVFDGQGSTIAGHSTGTFLHTISSFGNGENWGDFDQSSCSLNHYLLSSYLKIQGRLDLYKNCEASASAVFTRFVPISLSDSSLSFINLTIQAFGSLEYSGGALRLSGLGSLLMDSVTMINGIGYSGSFGLFHSINYVSIKSCDFQNGTSMNGGGLFFSNCGDTHILDCSFVGNTALNIGGALVFDSTSHCEIKACLFDLNKARRFGGAIASINGSLWAFSNNFTNNEAIYGGCMFLSRVSQSVIRLNMFNKTMSSKSGAIFWIYGTMGSPLFLTADNVFVDNYASCYGNNFASSAVRIATTPDRLLISKYESGSLNNFYASVVDFYGQSIRCENNTLLRAFISQDNKLKSKCLMNSPFLFGNLECIIKDGSCRFSSLGVGCIPGGWTNISLIVNTQSLWTLFPTFDVTKLVVNGKLVASTNVPIISTMTINFRNCVRGEIFDITSPTKSTCSVCKNGYSVRENLLNNIISCEICPQNAWYCYSNMIVLKDGFWRWGVNSTSIFQCALVGACKGGNRTGDQSCATGFFGPLCGICEPGYYLASNTCLQCSAKSIISPQQLYVIMGLGFLVVMPALVYILYKISKLSDDEIDAWAHKLFSEETEQHNRKQNRRLNSKMTLDDDHDEYDDEYDEDFHDNDSNDCEEESNSSFNSDDTTKEDSNNSDNSAMTSRLKLVATTFQIILQNPLSNGSSLPNSLNKMFNLFQVLQLNIASFFPIGCFTPYDFLSNMKTSTLMPIGIFLFLFVVCIIQLFFVFLGEHNPYVISNRVRIYIRRYFSWFLYACYFLLPGTCLTIFQTFACINVDPYHQMLNISDRLFLQADVSVSCTSSLYLKSRVWAILMVLVYPIGIPLFLYLLLHENKEFIRHRSLAKRFENASLVQDRNWTRNLQYYLKARSIESLEFIYIPYSQRYWFWEIVEISRRIILTAVIGQVIVDVLQQVTVTLCVIVLYIKIYSNAKPYASEIENILSEIGLYQLFFTFFVVYIDTLQSLNGVPFHGTFVSAIVISINIFASVLMIGLSIADYLEESTSKANKGHEVDSDIEKHSDEDSVEVIPFLCPDPFGLVKIHEIINNSPNSCLHAMLGILVASIVKKKRHPSVITLYYYDESCVENNFPLEIKPRVGEFERCYSLSESNFSNEMYELSSMTSNSNCERVIESHNNDDCEANDIVQWESNGANFYDLSTCFSSEEKSQFSNDSIYHSMVGQRLHRDVSMKECLLSRVPDNILSQIMFLYNIDGQLFALDADTIKISWYGRNALEMPDVATEFWHLSDSMSSFSSVPSETCDSDDPISNFASLSVSSHSLSNPFLLSLSASTSASTSASSSSSSSSPQFHYHFHENHEDENYENEHFFMV